MKNGVSLVAWLLLLAAIPAYSQNADDLRSRSIDELKEGIDASHPVAYYILAEKLFQEDQKNDAVFWFYAGQLRYRFHLAANPDLDPSGDPALFASMSQVVGKPINEYAFGDVDALVETFERVLAWDEETPNSFTSKSTSETQWRATRDGFEGFRKYVVENRETIRAQRTANGLENRN